MPWPRARAARFSGGHRACCTSPIAPEGRCPKSALPVRSQPGDAERAQCRCGYSRTAGAAFRVDGEHRLLGLAFLARDETWRCEQVPCQRPRSVVGRPFDRSIPDRQGGARTRGRPVCDCRRTRGALGGNSALQRRGSASAHAAQPPTTGYRLSNGQRNPAGCGGQAFGADSPAWGGDFRLTAVKWQTTGARRSRTRGSMWCTLPVCRCRRQPKSTRRPLLSTATDPKYPAVRGKHTEGHSWLFTSF